MKTVSYTHLVGLQRFGGAVIQRVQHVLGLQRCQQDARIAANDPQQRIVVFAFAIGCNGMEILPVLFIPEAEALPLEPLAFRRHRQKAAFGALLHHCLLYTSRCV